MVARAVRSPRWQSEIPRNGAHQRFMQPVAHFARTTFSIPILSYRRLIDLVDRNQLIMPLFDDLHFFTLQGQLE